MKFIVYLLVAIVVSGYLFPFGFTFLPASFTTKNFLALIGMPICAYSLLGAKEITLRKDLLIVFGIAVIFSIFCWFSIDYNGTNDTSYVTYFVSFLIWIFGAFTVNSLIRLVHGRSNMVLLAYYLAFVCVSQCMLALAIDRNEAFKLLVDTYIAQGQFFLNNIGRLYGIGASLDPAGVRFALSLVLITFVLVKEDEILNNNKSITLILLSIFIIFFIGNMISRTTVIAVPFVLFLLIKNIGFFSLTIHKQYIKLCIIFSLLLILVLGAVTYLYNTDDNFYADMRFAFEGFFNWIETGEWRTDSTDKLDREMWIWPTDLKTWLIGSGLFEGWVYGTDIGYCRFILYSGIIGFSLFSIFFISNSIIFINRMPNYRALFLIILILVFVVWIKVATDLFTFYALFYAMDNFNEDVEDHMIDNETQLVES